MLSLRSRQSSPPSVQSAADAAKRSFLIEHDSFYRDGEKVQLLAGSIHYFRVHPQVKHQSTPANSFSKACSIVLDGLVVVSHWR
jgi:hypothetical protein